MTERELSALREKVAELRDELKESIKLNSERHHRMRSDVAVINLLADGLRRSEASLSDHDDRLESIARSCENANNRLDHHKDRLLALEQVNVAVLAEHVKDLRGQVRWLIVSFVGMILSVLGGIIVFLVTQGVQ